MFNLCPPALIYVAFSLTQIIIDTFKGLYNTAFFKVIVMIVITILLNALCQAGMGIVSWIIVFVPFIFMSIIVAILLYVFGLDAATGQLNFKCDNCDSSTTTKSGNLIYSSSTVKTPNKQVKFVDVTYSDTPSDQTETQDQVAPFWSSDPQYE
jgi:ABC-type bacteriocin/lantibiotic exporter with double-glycine peptidase domain